MGKNAARLLIERMDGIYTNDTARNILIEPVLKIRDSVAQKS
jgi:DNA-binding LacI/PurR family transcriptional regulator